MAGVVGGDIRNLTRGWRYIDRSLGCVFLGQEIDEVCRANTKSAILAIGRNVVEYDPSATPQ